MPKPIRTTKKPTRNQQLAIKALEKVYGSWWRSVSDDAISQDLIAGMFGHIRNVGPGKVSAVCSAVGIPFDKKTMMKPQRPRTAEMEEVAAHQKRGLIESAELIEEGHEWVREILDRRTERIERREKELELIHGRNKAYKEAPRSFSFDSSPGAKNTLRLRKNGITVPWEHLNLARWFVTKCGGIEEARAAFEFVAENSEFVEE